MSGLAAREPRRSDALDGRVGMREVSWNLWWRSGRWRERYEAIVAELRRVRPDVCGLQEVWSDPEENMAASITEELGIGNAVLSRWPISESEIRRLPAGDEPDEGRVVLYARIDPPHGSVPFFATHLNSA